MEYTTKSQLAKRYGFDLKSISTWLNERGADSCWCTDKRKFKEPQITEWVVANIISPLRSMDNKEQMDAAKLRKLEAEASVAEMTAREKAGSLIPLQIVEASLSKFSSMVRTSMLQIATTQSQTLLEAAGSTRELKAALTSIITERLTEVGSVMSEGEFLDDDEITQHSEDEVTPDGHTNDTRTNQDSVSGDTAPDIGVSDTRPDRGDTDDDPDFFD